MSTITVSMPSIFNKTKAEFPDINWNEVMKAGILKRLNELKRFEELKNEGVL
ncbi:MAG: hypothetical protein Q7J10_06060 [Methanosarcinaceae archaeon]|nr:hypothetical protein [Methanosarcinaceae archaeon]